MGTGFARSSMSVYTKEVHIYVCALWWPPPRRDHSIRVGRACMHMYTSACVCLHNSRGGGFRALPATRPRRSVRITKRAGGMAKAKAIKIVRTPPPPCFRDRASRRFIKWEQIFQLFSVFGLSCGIGRGETKKKEGPRQRFRDQGPRRGASRLAQRFLAGTPRDTLERARNALNMLLSFSRGQRKCARLFEEQKWHLVSRRYAHPTRIGRSIRHESGTIRICKYAEQTTRIRHTRRHSIFPFFFFVVFYLYGNVWRPAGSRDKYSFLSFSCSCVCVPRARFDSCASGASTQ
ncbi:hypothetical protein TcCL_ESM10359 [Trypanosoma cruzi]|nr:hypothetical protein TcCL_ESM10359 [Trypanosoma cruzi]